MSRPNRTDSWGCPHSTPGHCPKASRSRQIDICRRRESGGYGSLGHLQNSLPLSGAHGNRMLPAFHQQRQNTLHLGRTVGGPADAMWLAKVMSFLCQPVVPRVWNRGAAIFSHNPDFHKQTKHILPHYP